VPTNPAGLIYGTITVAALLAAETARRETYAKTVGAVGLTLIVYWLAHSYAEFAGDRLADGEHVSVVGLLRAARRGLAVLMGAAIPFLVLLGCWASALRWPQPCQRESGPPSRSSSWPRWRSASARSSGGVTSPCKPESASCWGCSSSSSGSCSTDGAGPGSQLRIVGYVNRLARVGRR
jgi:hypothetical protein